MKSIYAQILEEGYQITDPMNRDFKSIDNIENSQLNFKNVRGSVRLQNGQVLTPKAFNDIKEKIIALKLK